MKKKLLILCIILGILLLFCSCKKKERNPNTAIEYLKNLNSYTCDVNLHIKNSKQEIDKECKQFYHNKYGNRLDINKDRVLIYNEKDIRVNDLNNNMNYILEKEFDSVYKLSFIQEYIGLLYTDEEISNSFKKIGDREYQLVRLTIPGNNRNINKAVMYINLENNYPEKVLIYDSKDNEILSFTYSNFMPNPEIQKEIFYIQKTKE